MLRFISFVAVWICASPPANAAEITATWINGTIGSWTDPANWSTFPVYPSNTETDAFDVVISDPMGRYDDSVTLDSIVTVRSLLLRGSDLANTGTLDVEADATLREITLDNTGTIRFSGSAELLSNIRLLGGGTLEFRGDTRQVLGTIDPNLYLFDQQVHNHGDFSWERGAISISTGTFTNEIGARFLISPPSESNNHILDVRRPFGAVDPRFLNYGDLIQIAPGLTIFEVPVESWGAIVVEQGQLDLQGFTSSYHGSLQASGPGILRVAGALEADSTLTGDGTVRLFFASVEGSVDLPGTAIIESATMDSLDAHVGHVIIEGFPGGGGLRVDGGLQTPHLTWSGGALSGTGTVDVSDRIDIVGNDTHVLDGFDLVNHGMGSLSGTVEMRNGAAIINDVDGTLAFDLQQYIEDLTSDSHIENRGTLIKQGPWMTTLHAAFSSSGVLRIEQGVFWVSRLDALSGDVYVGDGALLSIRTRTASDLEVPAAIHGPGQLALQRGSYRFGSQFEPGELILQETTRLDGELTEFAFPVRLEPQAAASFVRASTFHALDFQGELELMDGGRIDGSSTGFGIAKGSGTLVLDADVTSPRVAISGLTLENLGRFSFSRIGGEGSYLENAVFINRPGAEFRILWDQSGIGGLGQTAFINEGRFSVEPPAFGEHFIVPPFRNSGTVEVAARSEINFFTSYTQTAGELHLMGGSVRNTEPLHILGGSLTGSGLLQSAVEMAGTLAPGRAGGIGSLVLWSDLMPLDSATFDFDIGGRAAGVGYDQLVLQSLATLTLDGDLSLRFAGGFKSEVRKEDTFALIVTGSPILGAFHSAGSGERVLTEDGFGSFLVSYGLGSPFGPERVVLSGYQAVPEPVLGAPVTIAALALAVLRFRCSRYLKNA